MSKIEDLLGEITQAVSDMVADASGLGAQVGAIEQALADVAAALEAGAKTDAIVGAIKGLALTVTVNPTPVQVNVPEVSHRPFRPLVMKVTAYNHQGRIATVELFEKP